MAIQFLLIVIFIYMFSFISLLKKLSVTPALSFLLFGSCLVLQNLFAVFNCFNIVLSCGIVFFFGLSLLLTGYSLLKKFASHNKLGILPYLLLFSSLVLACFYIKPSNNVCGNNDEGMYFNFAVHLGESGRYSVEQPSLKILPEGLAKRLVQHLPGGAVRDTPLDITWPVSQLGLVLDTEKGCLLPLFPPGYPFILAAFYQVMGVYGIHLCNILCLFTSALLAGLIVQKLAGPIAAYSCVIIFLLFPLHIWMASTFLSELFLQMIFLVIIWLLSDRKSSPQLHGIAAGLLCGFSLIIKLESLFLFTALTFFAVLHFRSERTFSLSTLLACAVSSSVAFVSLFSWNQAYLYTHFSSLGILNAGIIGVILIGVTIALNEKLAFALRCMFSSPWIYLGFVSLLALLLLYGIFIRPFSSNPDTFFFWPSSSIVRSYREENLLRLTWYWGWGGFIIPAIGMFLFLWRFRTSEQILFYFLGLLVMIVLCYDLRNYPLQPYAMRRFIPYTIPFLIICSCTLWRHLRFLEWKRPLLQYIPLLVSLLLLTGFLPMNRMLSTALERDSVIPQINRLSTYFNPHSIILIRQHSSPGELALPLQLMYGQNVWIFKQKANPEDVELFIRTVRDNGFSVYSIGDVHPSLWLSKRLFAFPVSVVHMELFVDYLMHSLSQAEFSTASRRIEFTVFQQSADRVKKKQMVVSPSANNVDKADYHAK